MVRPVIAIVAATLTALAACGGPAARGPVPAEALPVASVLLTGESTTPPATARTAGAAQVQLRLVGELADPDSLVAEVVPVDAPDGSRRWPVDADTAALDGASATVTVPAYALPPGNYVVTVWRGDAEAVRRYPFRVVP